MLSPSTDDSDDSQLRRRGDRRLENGEGRAEHEEEQL